jgi:hypothetical protein
LDLLIRPLAVAVVLTLFASSTPAHAVAVVRAALTSSPPALAVTVSAGFSPLPPRFSVALKALASPPRAFGSVRATLTALVFPHLAPLATRSLGLLILRCAGLLILGAGFSLTFGLQCISPFVDLYSKRLLFLIGQGGPESKRGIGDG